MLIYLQLSHTESEEIYLSIRRNIFACTLNLMQQTRAKRYLRAQLTVD